MTPQVRLKIGRQSAGFISRGHPWLRRDRFTGSTAGLVPGQVIMLVDEHDKGVAAALADPASDACARVYAHNPSQPFDVATRVRAAWNARSSLHRSDSDCYRVVHGEADGLPGLRIERLGNAIVVQAQAACALPYLQAAGQVMHSLLPNSVVVIRDHIEDLRLSPVRSSLLDGGSMDPEAGVLGRELGVTVHLRPFAGLATGIYIDQRATRQWLRSRCSGARVLNLFAYSGLFSVSLLAAGAASAVDVDASAQALALATANAESNQVSAKHRIVHEDCQAFLARDNAAYDIVICDPPTAASTWVARRDYPALLALITPRLAPGGLLLAVNNTLGKPLELSRLLDWPREKTPLPAADIPQINQYPEGLPYRLWAWKKP